MNVIQKIKKKLHIHNWKPIVSKYHSFNTRLIVWECSKCGCRKSENEYHNYYSKGDFSIPTTHFIDHKEYSRILKGEPLSNFPHLLFHK